MSSKTLKELALLKSCYGSVALKESLAITIIFVNEKLNKLSSAKIAYSQYLGEMNLIDRDLTEK